MLLFTVINTGNLEESGKKADNTEVMGYGRVKVNDSERL